MPATARSRRVSDGGQHLPSRPRSSIISESRQASIEGVCRRNSSLRAWRGASAPPSPPAYRGKNPADVRFGYSQSSNQTELSKPLLAVNGLRSNATHPALESKLQPYAATLS